jgi:hypothetical protein
MAHTQSFGVPGRTELIMLHNACRSRRRTLSAAGQTTCLNVHPRSSVRTATSIARGEGEYADVKSTPTKYTEPRRWMSGSASIRGHAQCSQSSSQLADGCGSPAGGAQNVSTCVDRSGRFEIQWRRTFVLEALGECSHVTPATVPDHQREHGRMSALRTMPLRQETQWRGPIAGANTDA